MEKSGRMRDPSSVVFGKHPVLEAMRSDITIERIFIQKGASDAPTNTIIKKARARGIKPEFVDKRRLDEASGEGNHQGVVAYISEYKYYEIEDILALARSREEDPFVVLLDGIEDPQNLGAILRSVNLLGAHGVIIPKRGAAGLGPACGKAAAGAASHVMVAKVPNIKNAIEQLKDEGLWFIYADAKGESIYELDMTGPIGLVMGGEQKGVGELVRKHCDFSASIPMNPIAGEIDSFNAACAFSIIGCEISRQRSAKLNGKI